MLKYYIGDEDPTYPKQGLAYKIKWLEIQTNFSSLCKKKNSQPRSRQEEGQSEHKCRSDKQHPTTKKKQSRRANRRGKGKPIQGAEERVKTEDYSWSFQPQTPARSLMETHRRGFNFF